MTITVGLPDNRAYKSSAPPFVRGFLYTHIIKLAQKLYNKCNEIFHSLRPKCIDLYG
jgi:hypothetical protein